MSFLPPSIPPSQEFRVLRPASIRFGPELHEVVVAEFLPGEKVTVDGMQVVGDRLRARAVGLGWFTIFQFTSGEKWAVDNAGLLDTDSDGSTWHSESSEESSPVSFQFQSEEVDLGLACDDTEIWVEIHSTGIGGSCLAVGSGVKGDPLVSRPGLLLQGYDDHLSSDSGEHGKDSKGRTRAMRRRETRLRAFRQRMFVTKKSCFKRPASMEVLPEAVGNEGGCFKRPASKRSSVKRPAWKENVSHEELLPAAGNDDDEGFDVKALEADIEAFLADSD